MSYQDKIRTKLLNKVFNVIGKTVTFISKTSPIYNTRGDLENYTSTSSSITIIPYNLISEQLNYQPFGVLSNGEMDMAVPYTVNIHKNDEITMESITYTVINIDPNYLPDNTVTIIRLTKLIA